MSAATNGLDALSLRDLLEVGASGIERDPSRNWVSLYGQAIPVHTLDEVLRREAATLDEETREGGPDAE